MRVDAPRPAPSRERTWTLHIDKSVDSRAKNCDLLRSLTHEFNYPPVAKRDVLA